MLNIISKDDVMNLLYQSYEYGNLGLFIGAGFSKATVDNGFDNIALSWGELITEACEELGIEQLKPEDYYGTSYPEIATKLCTLYAKNNKIPYKEAKERFKITVCNIVNWLPNKEKSKTFSEYLSLINPSWIVTTNYDLVIERLLTGKCKTLGPGDYFSSPKGLVPIYHLHGVRHDPTSIVITQEDYVSLFRPTEYRQTKLALTIKESTTLVLGYQLGDINVQSAVDWSVNIFSKTQEYPGGVIQAVRKEEPSDEPYQDSNGNIIIEIREIEDFLKELTQYFEIKGAESKEKIEKINNLIGKLDVDRDIRVDKFINHRSERLELLSKLSEFEQYMIVPYIDFISACIDKTWENAIPDGAFEPYNQNLKILLDIVIEYEYDRMPPALFEFVAYSLDRVLNYVGEDPLKRYRGSSFSATKTWHSKKGEIPNLMLKELYSFSKYKYIRLHSMLKPLILDE